MTETLIFDCHTHPQLEACQQRGRPALDQFLRHQDRHGIRRVVSLGDVLRFGVNPTARQVSIVNRETMEICREFPEKVVGFCFLNPTLPPAQVEKEVRKCVVEWGFRGIKLEICNNARTRHNDLVLDLARSLDIPVLQHAWSTTLIGNRRHQSDPADVAALAKRHPGTRIIMAHLTGCGYRGIREVASLQNVWVDTSGSQPFYGVVEAAVRELGPHRVLYGSDCPVRDFGASLGRIFGARLTPAERHRVLWTNVHEILQLEEQK